MTGKFDITNPIFHDDDAARAHLEKLFWPNGPNCPRCGVIGDRITKLEGKSTRPGVYNCKDCRKPFSVTVGTVMERSHVLLPKWVLAAQLMASSKKGFSAHELHRLLGTNYETAWFLFHRLREAAVDPTPGALGEKNKVVEADETYIGGKEKNKYKSKRTPGGAPKLAVVALVERDGKSRSFHVANVNAKTLRPIMVKHASRKSYLMTDESTVYPKIGDEFAGHGTVSHSAEEYVTTRRFQAHEHGRVSFRTVEVGHLRHVPPHQRSPLAPLLCWVRLSRQHARHERLGEGGGAAGRGQGQEARLPTT